jgi:hypothetical protein
MPFFLFFSYITRAKLTHSNEHPVGQTIFFLFDWSTSIYLWSIHKKDINFSSLISKAKKVVYTLLCPSYLLAEQKWIFRQSYITWPSTYVIGATRKMEATLCWYWLKGEDIWLTRQVWAHYCCCHQHMP